MTRVRKLYKTWCKDNKLYFRRGNLKEECLQEAKNALLLYLRENNVTMTEAHFASTETTQVWDVAMYFASYFVGSITGSITTPTSTIWIGILCGCLGVALFYFPLKIIIWKYTKDINLSANTLLQITLECYQNIYATEMCTDTKIHQLFGGQTVIIPCQAEELYEQQMRKPKYYRYAYLLSINNGAHTFEYIWYTNTKYKKLNSHILQKFMDTCEEQIGIKWHNVTTKKVTMEAILSHDNAPA